jgi:hypothetical protein
MTSLACAAISLSGKLPLISCIVRYCLDLFDTTFTRPRSVITRVLNSSPRPQIAHQLLVSTWLDNETLASNRLHLLSPGHKLTV